MQITTVHFNDLDERYLVYDFFKENNKSTNQKSRKAAVKLLKSCIEHGLTEKQRICFTLAVLNNRKQKDIAEELGLDKTTVSRHISAAKKKLRKQYDLFGKIQSENNL